MAAISQDATTVVEPELQAERVAQAFWDTAIGGLSEQTDGLLDALWWWLIGGEAYQCSFGNKELFLKALPIIVHDWYRTESYREAFIVFSRTTGWDVLDSDTIEKFLRSGEEVLAIEQGHSVSDQPRSSAPAPAVKQPTIAGTRHELDNSDEVAIKLRESLFGSTYNNPIPVLAELGRVSLSVIPTSFSVVYEEFGPSEGESPALGCYDRPNYVYEGWLLKSGFDPYGEVVRVRIRVVTQSSDGAVGAVDISRIANTDDPPGTWTQVRHQH